jgi:hypothetical protein
MIQVAAKPLYAGTVNDIVACTDISKTDFRTNIDQLITRDSDGVWFDIIRLKKEYDIDNITSIEIIIKDYRCLFPMKLIKYLCKIVYTTNYTNIKFPIELWTKDLTMIPLIKLFYNEVRFRVNSTVVMYYDIVCTNYFYDNSDTRRNVAQTGVQFQTNNFMQDEFFYENNKLLVPRMYALSGMFLQTDKIPTMLSLQMNGHEFFRYDQDMIELHTIYEDIMTHEKIDAVKECFAKYNLHDIYLIKYILSFIKDEYLFWIPSIPNMNWKESQKHRLTYLINIDHTTLSISGCTGSVYYFSHNISMISDGMYVEKFKV